MEVQHILRLVLCSVYSGCKGSTCVLLWFPEKQIMGCRFLPSFPPSFPPSFFPPFLLLFFISRHSFFLPSLLLFSLSSFSPSPIHSSFFRTIYLHFLPSLACFLHPSIQLRDSAASLLPLHHPPSSSSSSSHLRRLCPPSLLPPPLPHFMEELHICSAPSLPPSLFLVRRASGR